MSGPQDVYSFLLYAHQEVEHAKFIGNSIPNVDNFAVERSVRILHAIHSVLCTITGLLEVEITQDVRKDTLEIFRQIFFYLEQNELLDMENIIHRICLYIVYQPRIQASLEQTKKSWNMHKLRTEHNKSPVSIYQLSRTKAINRGYWYNDPGDNLEEISEDSYGQEDVGVLSPPMVELREDPHSREDREFSSVEEEREQGILINEDMEIQLAREVLQGLDVTRGDGNWGIDVYCQAVITMQANLNID
ncbi:hypothetical protein BT96DRAFT_892551 [Gymnopus androsaceus JB14]|uniref:Integrase core domain-containing protein n=1 Tax=Gymnopus androsaceus JB14 TaxID=1447944 RepID=A0A6A4GFH0_9AGAR|nr:hypothetical protein BT96DRAFT_892551 [Gymnopus androsaceus JB14]